MKRSAASRPFYADDLAHVHDAGFRTFADRAAPEVLRRLGRARRGGRVVEIGCGSGALTRHLTRAGFLVVALDTSAAMVRLARRNAPGARFRVASWGDLAPPRCDAMVAVGECFNYMAAPRARDHVAALRRFFRRAAAALPPGGLLLFDFLEPHRERPRRRSVETWGDDWTVLVAIGEGRAHRVLTRHITTIRTIGGRARLSVEVHRQCLLRRGEIENALRTAGFTVRFRAGYGRRRLQPGQVVADAVRLGT